MVDSAFDDEWKLEVEEKVLEYSKQNLKDLDLDKEIEESEIVRCINKLSNNKTGGGDGIVSELLKYGGVGMVKMLGKLYALIWKEECVPMKWREGLIVSLFKKGDKEDPGNYRGITLLSVVGKVFCKILNDRLVQYLDKSSKIHEGQAGFRAGRCCIDNIFTHNELIQGRLKEGKKTFSFFLDIQKAYDSVWRNGLWLKLWNMGVKGKMWRVIKTMYNSSRSAVLLEGEKSSTFSVEQGVAGCSLSPILFSVFISDLLEEIDRAQIGIQLKSGNKVGGLLFADDFVGITESSENLQQLIDIIYGFCSKWRLHANVNKSAVLVFGKDKVKGKWNWGDHVLPIVSNYTYLGVDFSYNGAWDTHIKKLIKKGKQKVNQLNSIISNPYINLSARRMLLLSVLRPSLEYGSEVWEGNKSQAASLESIMLGGAKRVLGCSSKTSTKPFGEIWAWNFCKVGVINVSLVGGTRSLTCHFLDIQSNSFKKSGILNHVQCR